MLSVSVHLADADYFLLSSSEWRPLIIASLQERPRLWWQWTSCAINMHLSSPKLKIIWPSLSMTWSASSSTVCQPLMVTAQVWVCISLNAWLWAFFKRLYVILSWLCIVEISGTHDCVFRHILKDANAGLSDWYKDKLLKHFINLWTLFYTCFRHQQGVHHTPHKWCIIYTTGINKVCIIVDTTKDNSGYLPCMNTNASQ